MHFLDFLKRQVQVARVYSIPVRIDYRWFPIFAVIVWMIAANLNVGFRLGWVAALTLSFTTALLLFLSIFGHELAHALMARAENISTEEIVLHPFGGLARLERPPDTARAEFRIAVAGPAASFLFAVLGFSVYAVTRLTDARVATYIFFVIGAWNFLLAFFNLLPGYPLDGGRVLRAILWHRTGNLTEATRTSSLGGQLIAWTLIVIGAYIVIVWNDLLLGGWTVIVGLFLRDAAASVMRLPLSYDGFAHHGGRTVAEAMMKPVVIAPEMLISHLVDSILPVQRHTTFAVAQNNRLHGILALKDLKSLPRERWHRTRARDVMRPVAEDLFIQASGSIPHAEEKMNRNGIGALGVINASGELVGFLQRAGDK